jgi:uncharacterized protein
MAESANVTLIRDGYTAFGKGDMDALGKLFTDDVVWHTAGTSPIAGEHKGKEATFNYFGQLAELSGGTFKVDLHDCVGNDQHVVGIQSNSARRNGSTLDNEQITIVFHMSDGRCNEAWEQHTNRAVWDSFWS